jgi:hypothetical protein
LGNLVEEYHFGRQELGSEEDIKVGLHGVGCENVVTTEVFLDICQR